MSNAPRRWSASTAPITSGCWRPAIPRRRCCRLIADRLEAAGRDAAPAGARRGLRDCSTPPSAAPAKVRDRFSIDGWMALRDLAKTARSMAATAQPGDDAARAMSVLLRKLAGFTGLVHENMYRFTGWRFLSVGRALERADRMTSVLACFADPDAPEGSFDVAVEVGDSVMTHKRRFTVETNRATVIDLLALDNQNPRAVIYQLTELKNQIAMLPNAVAGGQLSPLSREILRLHTELAIATPDVLDTEELLALKEEIARLSDSLTATYLT